MKLYVIECRPTRKAKWRIYGGDPTSAYMKKPVARGRMNSARVFNKHNRLGWEFRVSTFVPSSAR